MAQFDPNDYIPVHERITKFYAANPVGRINTEIVKLTDDGFVVMKAEVYRNFDDAAPSATGHAFELAGAGHVNKTSHIENCETSAIGRALANLGIEITRGIASREEMQKVQRMQPATQPQEQTATRGAAMNGVATTPPSSPQTLADLATPKQLGAVRALCRDLRLNAEEECQGFAGCSVDHLTKKKASEFIELLDGWKRGGNAAAA